VVNPKFASPGEPNGGHRRLWTAPALDPASAHTDAVKSWPLFRASNIQAQNSDVRARKSRRQAFSHATYWGTIKEAPNILCFSIGGYVTLA